MTRPHRAWVVAIGGHALAHPDEPQTIETQRLRAGTLTETLMPLLVDGRPLVITHGNGTQVGLRMREADASPAGPPALEVAVAGSQGEIGYLIEQSLQNTLIHHRLRRPVVSLLTQTLVDPEDPAFQNPDKPVGPILDDVQAAEARRHGYALQAMPGGGHRRLVPSPHPLAIADTAVIRLLLDRGVVVIAAGGGGVPVIRLEDGTVQGTEGVVDKDLASAVLAENVGAERLLILTGVPAVFHDFGGPEQRELRHLTVSEAEELLQSGTLPAGSMAPKVEAAAQFVRCGGTTAVITDAAHLAQALDGGAGTVVTRDEPA